MRFAYVLHSWLLSDLLIWYLSAVNWCCKMHQSRPGCSHIWWIFCSDAALRLRPCVGSTAVAGSSLLGMLVFLVKPLASRSLGQVTSLLHLQSCSPCSLHQLADSFNCITDMPPQQVVEFCKEHYRMPVCRHPAHPLDSNINQAESRSRAALHPCRHVQACMALGSSEAAKLVPLT